MALRPLFCLFYSGHLKQVSLYVFSIYPGVDNWKVIA